MDAADRGFTLGDGLFETILVYQNRPIFLEEHLRRLQESASLLGIKMPIYIKEGIKALLENKKIEEASLRITVTRGIQKPGLWIDSLSQASSLVITLHDYERDDRARSYHIAQERRYSGSILSRIKSLNYLPQVLAQREAAEKSADEAMMLNEHVRIVSCARANLFLIRGKVLLTPPLSEGILPGIIRAKILTLGAEMGLEVSEQVIFPTDLERAEEAFITNSLMLVQPLAGKADKFSRLFQSGIWHQVKEAK